MYRPVCPTICVSSVRELLAGGFDLGLQTYNAFPIPMTHAVPVLQPLDPSPDCVKKEPGCVCFFSPNSIQKTTMKPDTERKRVACVNLGTDLGEINSGAATNSVNFSSTASDELARRTHL